MIKSFVDGAAAGDCLFPIQHLPYGVFRPATGGEPRVGVAIGHSVLDLAVLESRGLIVVPEAAGDLFAADSLNGFMRLGRSVWTAVRERITQLLRDDEPILRDDAALREIALIPQSDVEMLLPVDIPDYTDFYSSLHHATNVGTMIRGADNALQENWKHLPVAYHGRAGSVVVSGTPIHRPSGQIGAGKFSPSKAIDFEIEMGFFVGEGPELGTPISIDESHEYIFGMVLVNDWSARDIQKWEYVPLGPFLAKNFATSISPWVVPLDALAPFRADKPEQQNPAPLPYLQWADDCLFDIQIDAFLTVSGSDQRQRISTTNFKNLYWTPAQQLAHHTVNGCNMRAGDLLASGTISGPEPESRGCLLELTWRGETPLQLADNETRVFLQDGDRLTISAFCQGDGYRIGFGEVTGQITNN